jgi:hypothetical protein
LHYRKNKRWRRSALREFSFCLNRSLYFSLKADVVVVVVLALEVGVSEDVVGLVQPAARTAASITTANAPAKNDFFIVTLVNYP